MYVQGASPKTRAAFHMTGLTTPRSPVGDANTYGEFHEAVLPYSFIFSRCLLRATMIVGEYFKGDITEFQSGQHDVYNRALGLILNGCRNRYIDRFKDDLSNEIVPSLRSLSAFDHRVLQAFHDHLAAYWRKKHFNSEVSLQQNAEKWLIWLEQEIQTVAKNIQVCVGVCFLALEKYDSAQEKQVIGSLQSFACRAYPYKWKHCLRRLSVMDALTLPLLMSAFIFGCLCLYSATVSPTGYAMTLVLGALIFLTYVYCHHEQLHLLCLKNVFIFSLRLGVIAICSGLAGLFLAGIADFQSQWAIKNAYALMALMVVTGLLALAKQLCTRK